MTTSSYFWVPHWGHFWVIFLYFLWFEVSKNGFGLQARFLMIFSGKNCWFLLSQPLKNTIKTTVFVMFHFSDFLLIWVTSRTCLDLIWVTLEGLGALKCAPKRLRSHAGKTTRNMRPWRSAMEAMGERRLSLWPWSWYPDIYRYTHIYRHFWGYFFYFLASGRLN